ncbi:MAG: protein kinase [Planctomycetaceae bacterium]
MDSLTPDENRRVMELVDQFEIALEDGQVVSLETLCTNETHLIPAVEFSLRRLQAIDNRLKPVSTLKSPTSIGEFDVEKQIGLGGSGFVFQCRQRQPDRKVAIKVLKPGIEPSEQRRRFRRELNVFSSLQCDGLAEVYVTGVARWNGVDCFWIAMELLEGGRVDHFVATNQLSQYEILKLLLTIGQTLQAAHRAGVIHCDLKPSNILMSLDGRPHIVDFGVAKTSGSEQTTASVIEVAGTVAWMAPELLIGEIQIPDTRTDIFSFGLIACRLLTGKHPYPTEGKPLTQVVQFARNATRVNLPQAGYEASRDLTTFVERLTERDPADRYQNMDHVVSDLVRLINGEPISVRRVSPAERSWRWCLRNRKLALLMAAITIAVFWAAGVTVVSAVKEREYLSQLKSSHQQLLQSNTELQQRTTELDQRSLELEHLTNLQHRSLVSARLNEISTNLLTSDPAAAHQQLNDPTLFPIPLRGITWQILHAQSLPKMQLLQGVPQRVVSVCFSHRGDRVAFSGKGGQLSVGNVSSGDLLWTAESSNLRSKLRFSLDDKWLYGFSRDHQLLCVDSETGVRAKSPLPEVVLNTSLMDISQDGSLLVVVSENNELFVVNLESSKHKTSQLETNLNLKSIWFENEDRTITALTENGICLEWNADDLQLDRTTDLRLSEPDFDGIVMGDGGTDLFGHRVRIGCRQWELAIANFPEGNLANRSFHSRGDIIRDVSLVRPDQMLVTMTRSSQLVPLLAPGPGQTIGEKNIRTYSHAVTEDSSAVAIGDDQGNIRVYDLTIPTPLLKTLQPEVTVNREIADGFPLTLIPGVDDDRVFLGFSDGFVAEMNSASGRILAADRPGLGAIPALLMAKDQTWLAAAVGGRIAQAGIAVYSLAAPRNVDNRSAADDSPGHLEQKTFLQSGRVRTLCQSTDGTHVYAGLQNGEILVIDCQSWQVIDRRPAHESGVYAMTVSDGKLISGGTDGGVAIWNESPLTLNRKWTAHEKRVLDLAVSPDGQRIVSVSFDHSAAIWNNDGTLVQRIRGHSAPIQSVAISSDGQTIATGSHDYTIRLWDGLTGAAQMTLRHDGNAVSAVHFTGNQLLATTQNGTLEIWAPPALPNAVKSLM